MKQCFKCKEVKPLSEFYKHPRMLDGHLNKCIECNKKDALEHRLKNIDRIRAYDKVRSQLPHRKELAKRAKDKYRKEHPLRARQNLKLRRAVKSGQIKKPSQCYFCGSTGKILGHHTDYLKPLDVVWVCQPCHKKLHNIQKVAG